MLVLDLTHNINIRSKPHVSEPQCLLKMRELYVFIKYFVLDIMTRAWDLKEKKEMSDLATALEEIS